MTSKTATMHPMEHYDPTSTEAKWQKKWAEARVYEVDLKKAKDPYYCMVMFPFPSGAKLHVGHWFQYSLPDSFSRFQKMKGKDVFHPMGFDSFGLPAENYAIKTGLSPIVSTKENIATMTEQFRRMGVMYDWNYALDTSDPSYYKWTQWLFTLMFEKGLAYKKHGNVNWCPKDQTVLANEQVKEGLCERCGTEVIQKPLEQWYFKITQYADRLLEGLDTIDWPERTKAMQRNWIGKSEGAEIEFGIEGSDETIKVFTTRPDTIFGVTYIVLAPEHALVEKITPKNHWGAVHAFREEVKKKTEMERTELNKNKTGIATGAFAIHPVTKEKLPVWIADYVLANYGTGCVMAVPAHDERDNEFAKNYDLPIVEVMEGEDPYGEGKATKSDFLDGLATQEAKKKIIAWLENNHCGRSVTQYRLRDWLVCRQRYWGAPTPIVYDPEGKPHVVPEKHLPWLLPTDVDFKPDGASPLARSKELVERTEKIFGKGWKPEVDTLDGFVCSSFYYLRFLMQGADTFIDPTLEKKWLPVDMYIGGAEHATMHLLYARFVMMALKDFGITSHSEPFQNLFHQGLVTKDGAKMSKSKGNVISPDSFVEQYGADVFRMYLMFMGPFSDGGDWSDTGINGIVRFVQRIRKILLRNPANADSRAIQLLLHKSIKQSTDYLERLQFNTCISTLMELLNGIEKEEGITLTTARIFVTLLAPLAPHLAEELWEQMGGEGFVVQQSWPTFDPAMLVADSFTIAVQVNGKLRATIEVPASMPKEDILALAKQDANVQKFLEGNAPKKEIYVPGKLVSLVV